MGRKQKKCPKKCQIHRFQLKPVAHYAHLSRELQACFCPSGLKKLSITPTFNKDNCHFTSGFYLPVEQERLKNNEDFYREEHERCIKENPDQKSQILIAKPRTKNSYCNVCKDDFEDYLDHIRSENHKKKIRQSKFEPFIHELCSETRYKHQIKELEHQFIKTFPSCQTNISFGQYQLANGQDKILFRTSTSLTEGTPQKTSHGFKTFPKSFIPSIDPIELMQLEFPLEQNEIGQVILPLSPIKKYSEITEGSRLSHNVKPIIILGSTYMEI